MDARKNPKFPKTCAFGRIGFFCAPRMGKSDFLAHSEWAAYSRSGWAKSDFWRAFRIGRRLALRGDNALFTLCQVLSGPPIAIRRPKTRNRRIREIAGILSALLLFPAFSCFPAISLFLSFFLSLSVPISRSFRNDLPLPTSGGL